MMLWLFSTFFALCLTAAAALLPLLAIDRLGLPEGFYGVLLLTEALGAVVAALVVDRLRRRLGTGRTMAIAGIVGSLAFVFVWAVPTLWALAAALFVYAASIASWNVLIISLRQAAVPSHLLGRVHGTWRTLHWGAAPIGAVLGGLLGRVDVTLPFLLGGGASALVLLLLAPRFARLPEPEEL